MIFGFEVSVFECLYFFKVIVLIIVVMMIVFGVYVSLCVLGVLLDDILFFKLLSE